MTRAVAGLALVCAAIAVGRLAIGQGFTPHGACAAHQWNAGYGSMTAAGDCAQPGFADISGTVPNAQLAQMGAYTIKGNGTNATASPADISVGNWTSYTPTLACGSGSVGAAATTGYYQKLGKTVLLSVSVTISSLGTCGTNLQLSTPTGLSPATVSEWVFSGQDNNTGGVVSAWSGLGLGYIQFSINPAAHGYAATGLYQAS